MAIKVLHMWPSLDQGSGGPLRAILDLSASTSRYGIHSEVLGFGPLNVPDNPLDASLIHSLPTRFPKSYFYVPQLRRWLAANLRRYDGVVIHGMWLYPQWATARECQAAGVPYACFPHGMLEPWSVFGQGFAKSLKKFAWWWLRERRMYSHSQASLFTTRRELAEASRSFELPQRRFIVVPYGIETREPVDRPPCAALVPPAGSRMALFLGRVDPKKNAHFLIEAWARANVPAEWQLYFAGPCEAQYRRELQQLVERHGLGQRVRFVGMVTGADKAYLFERADWFLLPSKQENFGIAVLEAISRGCPVAVSDQVYIAEHFHERSEVLPLQMEAWVDFLRHRLADETRRRELIAADRTHIFPQFRMETVAREWARTMTELFHQKAA